MFDELCVRDIVFVECFDCWICSVRGKSIALVDMYVKCGEGKQIR